MKTIANKLKNNLLEQLNFYNYMERLTTEKKDLIIKGDAESLAELDKNIEAVACQILELEEKRLKLLEGRISKNSRLSDFIIMLEPDVAEPLKEIGQQLLDVMTNIKKLNDINIYLIKNSIKWIEYSVATIANALAPESAAYNASGKALSNSPYNNTISSSNIVEHEA